MILILTETLTAGGAEIFALRLARQLNLQGYSVIVFNCHNELTNAEVIEKFSDVNIVHFTNYFDWFLIKIDRLMLKLHIDKSIRQRFISKQLRKIIRDHRIRVVHSHLFNMDYSFAKMNRSIAIRQIITNHGDYQLFHSMPSEERKKYVLNFEDKATFVYKHVSSIICIAQSQRQQILNTYGNELASKIKLIYSGFSITPFKIRSRESLHINASSLVFGMVARGIKEKGWKYALSAFLELNDPNTHLILVGDGEYLKSLEIEISKHENVHYVGFSNNSLEWIAIFDVALLPSYYKAESQPNIILECLSLGKPVICSEVGDVKTILNVGSLKQCGFVIGVKQDKPEIDKIELQSKMLFYLNNPEQLKQHSINASGRFMDFDMVSCVNKYIKEYFST